METLILGAEEIRRIAVHVGLHRLMDDLIDRLATAFERFDGAMTFVPARQGFVYTEPALGLIEWMPCMADGGRATIKVVGYHPENARSAVLPTIVSTVSAYDTGTGHLRCLMDGTFLTALRTGATSAVASRILGSTRTDTVGLIGAGAQAVTQLHALSRVFDVDRVLVYDVDPRAQQSFPHRVRSLVPNARVAIAPLDLVVSAADVICTATSVGVGEGPVFDDVEPKPWAHFNAVGSDFPGKVELPEWLLRRSFVCPDFRDQAVQEGECQQLSSGDIGPNLYQVVQEPGRYAPLQDQLTVFDSTGWALEDHVAMALLMEYADDLEIGRRILIEATSGDVLDPYHFIGPSVESLTISRSSAPAVL